MNTTEACRPVVCRRSSERFRASRCLAFAPNLLESKRLEKNHTENAHSDAVRQNVNLYALACDATLLPTRVEGDLSYFLWARDTSRAHLTLGEQV